MFKKCALCLILFYGLFSYAQEIPKIILKDSTSLKLEVLDINVEVIGNVVNTTYDMTFYNSTGRILEGELSFPLSQGQVVSQFALDVNGKMRDASIVEKELGRVAYESTVRQVIDPGLLEMTQGNNYKARIYPIPANGHKRLKITCEQQLSLNLGHHTFEIPLNFKENIDSFSIGIDVIACEEKPLIHNEEFYGLIFSEKDKGFQAKIKKSHFKPEKIIKVSIPILDSEQVSTYQDFFNVYKVLNPQSRIKDKPKLVTIYWDKSFSMEYRELEKELQLLKDYISYLNDVKIQFISFADKAEKEKHFKINNGNYKAIISHIKGLINDGGTSYLSVKNTKADEYILFTDGLNNLSKTVKKFKAPTYIINSLTSANHQALDFIATNSGGKYINLKRIDVRGALNSIKTETYQFLGIRKNDHVYDVYPKSNINVSEDFLISGKCKQNTTIELMFGYGNKVLDTYKVNISKSNDNAFVKRIWANAKLNHLVKNKEENKTEIVSHAKRYQLISPYTSMIVLDRIEDYVRYKIEPPVELKSEYKRLLNEAKADELSRLEDIEDRKEELLEDLIDIKDWYATDFPLKKKKSKVVKTSSKSTEGANSQEHQSSTNAVTQNTTNAATQNQNNSTENTQRYTLDTSKRTISGTIEDPEGLPLPGVNIFIKGTTKGVQTDFDGRFSINAEEGEVLVVSYVGFKTIEQTIGVASNLSIKMKTDNSQLEEVIITAYAATKKETSVSASVIVTSESVEEAVNQGRLRTLQGQVAGLNITKGNGQPGNNSEINIRGTSSIQGSSEPLIIVDGVPVESSEYKKLNSEDINSIRVLKDHGATGIYGNRGSNGVIVINTKEGIINNSKRINELNEQIDAKISLKPWKPNAEYMVALYDFKDINKAYEHYLQIRKEYLNMPTFFIDVADYFESRGRNDIALKIVTNLMEIKLDDHELMRALAYKLDYLEEYEMLVHLNQLILDLRPEEPHSYRDLALSYERVGEYQKAFDILDRIAKGDFLIKDEDERFYGIEHIAYVEACHLYTKHENRLKLDDRQTELYNKLKTDIRVVVDWNHNDTDLDLWIDNPTDKSISYKNKYSDIGDRISEDMTDGYGPEEYMLKKAIKGDYEILIDYYGDEVQKISGPTTLKVTIFKNYGSKNEERIIRIVRLSTEKEEIEVGKIQI